MSDGQADLMLLVAEQYLRTRAAWRNKASVVWAERNPRSVDGVNDLWERSYGIRRADLLCGLLEHVSRSSRILEVGASSGAQLAIMQELGFGPSMWAVDISEDVLQENPRHGTAADAVALPFADRSFDLVMTCGTLMHIPPGPLRISALEQLGRVSAEWVLLTEYWHESRYFAYCFAQEMLPPVWTDHWGHALPEVDRSFYRVSTHARNAVSGRGSPIETVLFRRLRDS